MFAPPASRFLEGQEFLGGGVVGQGLRVQDDALRADLLEGSRDEFWEHVRLVFQVA